jgi:hypothetical protein
MNDLNDLEDDDFDFSAFLAGLRIRDDKMSPEHNMEYTMMNTEWFVEKVKQSESYSQNLYAALCNNDFAELDDTWSILNEDWWSCSWRTAGGIVANLRDEGDYLDWYCSGMKGSSDSNSDVSEGYVTEEIKEDLKKLGWAPVRN